MICWINVKEALPEEDTEVLAYKPGKVNDIVRLFYICGDFYDLNGVEDHVARGVTHWTEINLPKEIE